MQPCQMQYSAIEIHADQGASQHFQVRGKRLNVRGKYRNFVASPNGSRTVCDIAMHDFDTFRLTGGPWKAVEYWVRAGEIGAYRMCK